MPTHSGPEKAPHKPAVNALIASGIRLQEEMFEFAERMQAAKTKEGGLSAEENRMLSEIRAGMRMIEGEDEAVPEPKIVATKAETVAQNVQHVLQPAARTLSAEEMENFEALLDVSEGRFTDAFEAIKELPVKKGLPDNPCNPENKKKLQDQMRTVLEETGGLRYLLRGAELDNGGKDMEDQLRIAVIQQLHSAYELLTMLRGARNGVWISEGAMDSTRARATICRLAEGIESLYRLLQQLNIEASAAGNLRRMFDESQSEAQMIRRQDREKTNREGKRAEDFSGGYKSRKRAYDKKTA